MAEMNYSLRGSDVPSLVWGTKPLSPLTVSPANNKFNWSIGQQTPSPNFMGGESLGAIPNVNLMDPMQANPNSLLSNSAFQTPTTSPGLNLGGWFDPAGKGGMALSGLQTATGAFNAWMGNKNRKFLQDYYGEQMARQKVDFNNAVGTQNLNMESALTQKAANNNITDPAARRAEVAKGMEQWGAKKLA